LLFYLGAVRIESSQIKCAPIFQTHISDAYEFLAVLFPLTCSLCLVNSILTAAVTKTVDKSESGTMLGINMAVHSAIRSFAPTAGGYLMTTYGFESLGYLGVACNVVVFGMVAAVFQGNEVKEKVEEESEKKKTK
jgi:predicted MFS family arabinose efflux permease